MSVGAAPIKSRATRWLSDWAARLAFYRSYRDDGSREAMGRRGLAGTDAVFPDLAFSLPLPRGHRNGAGDWSTIGLGVMAYHGSNDDRDQAAEIYADYIEGIKEIVRWLIAGGRRVRLFIGDTDGSDEGAVNEILADVRTFRPDLDSSWVIAEPVSTFNDIMEALEPLGAMIATRFHNLIAAVMLSKPTIAVGYSAKHRDLMAEMGLAEFSHSIDSLDVGAVTAQFLDLERRSAELVQTLTIRTADKAATLEKQFDELDQVVFGQCTPSGSDEVPLSAAGIRDPG